LAASSAFASATRPFASICSSARFTLAIFPSLGHLSGIVPDLTASSEPSAVRRLVQQRRVQRSVFEATPRQVVRALEEQLAEADRIRWLELLSYLSALIYHERERPEHEPPGRGGGSFLEPGV
jgi:hypothetical protein